MKNDKQTREERIRLATQLNNYRGNNHLEDLADIASQFLLVADVGEPTDGSMGSEDLISEIVMDISAIADGARQTNRLLSNALKLALVRNLIDGNRQNARRTELFNDYVGGFDEGYAEDQDESLQIRELREMANKNCDDDAVKEVFVAKINNMFHEADWKSVAKAHGLTMRQIRHRYSRFVESCERQIYDIVGVECPF